MAVDAVGGAVQVDHRAAEGVGRGPRGGSVERCSAEDEGGGAGSASGTASVASVVSVTFVASVVSVASRCSSIMRTIVGTPRTWVGRCARTAARAASGVKWSSRTRVPPCRARVTGVPLEPNAEASGTRKRQRGGVRSGMSEARKLPRPPASALCEYAIILGSDSEPDETRMRAGPSGSGRAGTNAAGSPRSSSDQATAPRAPPRVRPRRRAVGSATSVRGSGVRSRDARPGARRRR